MKLVLGLFGLENFYGGDVKSYIEIAQMGEELGFDAVALQIMWSWERICINILLDNSQCHQMHHGMNL